MKLLTIVAVIALLSACSSKGNALAPTPIEQAPNVITYAINIPDAHLAQQLTAQFPKGITIPPIVAQVEYDYTSTYGVSNVYYGPQGPNLTANGTSPFNGTGIVVAPASVADEMIFTGSEWPVVAAGLPLSTRFTWVGRFVYAKAGK